MTMVMLRLILLLCSLAFATPACAQGPLPVHVGGRVVRGADGSFTFGWPGVYFESRFRGTGVVVAVDSGIDHFRLLVDGRERDVLVRPGNTRIAIDGLAPGDHVVRLEKLTESQSGSSRFVGFFAEDGIEPLDPPARARRIEYIGDSLTVGYGNTSPSRTCTPARVHDTTDTSLAFGPLVARRLDADYRVNAFSGFGIVRNYGGSSPELSLPTIYDRLIPGEAAPVQAAGEDGWRPQLIVVNLGSNDFSTPLRDGERWPNGDALSEDYRLRYFTFMQGLMARQPQARFIMMAPERFASQVEAVASVLERASPGRVTVFHGPSLDLGGCDWHPSRGDHRAIAERLERTIRAMDGLWD